MKPSPNVVDTCGCGESCEFTRKYVYISTDGVTVQSISDRWHLAYFTSILRHAFAFFIKLSHLKMAQYPHGRRLDR